MKPDASTVDQIVDQQLDQFERRERDLAASERRE
jgi:hypothetical protein